MSAEGNTAVELEIAHVLFIDTVGYSKLLIEEQRDVFDALNRLVKQTQQFRTSEAAGKLIRLPTGDGMALVFSDSPEAPVRCALEISKAVQSDTRLRLRMGIHSGPVSRLMDVNDRSNAAGAGINTAQRVMAFGDAGHILLSKRAAEDLAEYRHWQPFLHNIGEYEVKHGTKISVFNLHTEELGNPNLPARCQELRSQLVDNTSNNRRWPMAFALGGLTLLLIAAYAFFGRGTSAPSPSAKSIAVLPFENLSDDKQNAFFTDGVQDEILNHLAKVADLKVISRTSAMQYKGVAPRNLRQIAKDLGVAHVVEGTVQRIGDRVRVSAQLIDARTDTHMWAEHYDCELADVFRIQSEVAEKVVAQLRAKLSPEEKAAIEERPTHDLDAYDLYLRARNLIEARSFDPRQRESLCAAIGLLESAIARDPKFVSAYYQLASAHDLLYFQGFDRTPDRLARADAAVNTITALRPDSGEAHLAQAQHFYWGYLDYDHSRQELAAARRVLPNEPLVLVLAGFIDRRQGRWEESARELEAALQLDPRNLFILQQLSFSYENMRRFDAMDAVLGRALTVAPTDRRTQLQRAIGTLESRSDSRAAHQVIESVRVEDPKALSSLADRWTFVALCERDPTAGMRALAQVPPEGISENGVNFPHGWYEGLFARLRGDEGAAREAFTKARTEVEKTLHDQPSYAEQLSVLGMIDAALGHKEKAIPEAQRGVELLPLSKDSIRGALLIECLAIVYAWSDEKDRAFEQLAIVTRNPSDVNYGHLRLHPYWDPLRKDPRFEQIVTSLVSP